MKLLVFGGSLFLSRAMAAEAVRAGHDVTTFNRGISGAQVDGARHLTGDRTNPADLAQLANTGFDLVFDTAYRPTDTKAAAELLAPTSGHYVFISSINAYPGWPTAVDYRHEGEYDGDPDADGDALPDGIEQEQAYGWRKVGCERAARRAFGDDRTGILRAGAIVGPEDRTGRLPWWLDRIARGGETLVPGQPDDVIRFIDTRDIAAFALLRPSGVFETSGPAGQMTRREFYETLKRVTGSDATFTWVSDEFLGEHEVAEWTELPLWATGAPSLFGHDTTEAEKAGLSCRPVRQTAEDVWQWMQSIEGGWQPSERTPGLAPEREQQLLAQWHSI